jgi:hypothetical protein
LVSGQCIKANGNARSAKLKLLNFPLSQTEIDLSIADLAIKSKEAINKVDNTCFSMN